MSVDVLATVLTGAAVLVGVWRLVESVRRDLGARIAGVERRVERVEERLSGELAAVNGRIDAVLLADRRAS